MTRLSFRVYGIPAPAGSKTVVPTKAGPRVVDGNSKTAREARGVWRSDVVNAARAAIDEQPLGTLPLTGPIDFRLHLYVPRPKNLPKRRKDGTTPQPTTRPDLTKLLRATEDALTVAGVWHDDSQVVILQVTKSYADDQNRPGAVITVEPW